MAQTVKQREAAERARARRAEAEAAARAQQRRRFAIVAGIAGVLLVGGIIAVGLLASRDGGAPVAEPEPTPTAPAIDITNDDGVPDPAIAEGREWASTLATNHGDIDLTLFGDLAPQAVANFVTLAREGFFDLTQCHRLTTAGIYVLQCGDPTATGTGGPDWRFGPIENAPADNIYPAGTLAMARVGQNAFSMGSQFFLVYEDSMIPADTAGGYTIFGEITSGLDIVRAIADEGVAGGGGDGRPATDVTIEGVTVQ